MQKTAHRKKRILLKLTGEIFLNKDHTELVPDTVNAVIKQIKELQETHQFGIVVGGGNFFRGSQHGTSMGIRAAISHQIGMLGTMMNGLMLKDLIDQHGLQASLFCAMPSPEIGKPIAQQTITSALKDDHILIFTGGTGNPFFTTDTTAVLRALQMGADEVWKGTTVNGVYSTDPDKNSNAKKLTHVSFNQAINDKLGIMDITAYAMAERYNITIRVFDVFAPNSLIDVATNTEFGSTIS